MGAFIYDHVRTPRGKDCIGGCLHRIAPAQLAARTLIALRKRNQIDTALIEDMILGCVSPIGEQEANPGRIVAIAARYSESVSS